MIRIIHLTDFHLNREILKDWTNYIKISLLDKLRELHNQHPITLIAFTGDLIDQGGKDYTDAPEAFSKFKLEVIGSIGKPGE